MKKLAIVIGHTDIAKGASLVRPFSFVQEYEYNTILASLVSALAMDIERLDVRVFLRDKRGINNTYVEVESWKADASIELHFNAFDGKADGSMVLFGGIPRSDRLAYITQQAILEVMKNHDRRTQFIGPTGRGGASVNGGNVPRILIEPFFGSDLNDARRGLVLLPELAKAILKAAVDFIYS